LISSRKVQKASSTAVEFLLGTINWNGGKAYQLLGGIIN
jgi:hypothetical protein